MPTSPPHVRTPTSGPIFGVLEEPRQRVAARARHLVRDHHLRAVDRLLRERSMSSPSRVGRAHRGVHCRMFDDVVGDLAAVIEALVEDDGVLADLREVVAIEVRRGRLPRCRECTRNRRLPRDSSVDLLAIVLHPAAQPQRRLGAHGHDRDLARAVPSGFGRDGDRRSVCPRGRGRGDRRRRRRAVLGRSPRAGSRLLSRRAGLR